MEFALTAECTISIYTVVEAETLEEAIEIAQDRSIEASAWHSEQQAKEVWISGEYDGDPTNIKQE